MRFKFAFVYIAAGVAFVAVSLWAFLSNGKSAKAIRYKYKLGGIMLTAWTMLSAASCEGTPPYVTCYDPVVECYDVAVETDRVTVTVKDYGSNRLKPGDVMIFSIADPMYREYRFCIHEGDYEAPVFQEFTFLLPEDASDAVTFQQELAPTDFRGTAQISVYGVLEGAEGQKIEDQVNAVWIEIVG